MYLNWLDEKYVALISHRLKFFKKRNNAYNFRCPICGDSTKSKTKCRAWIYKNKNAFDFYCYNCNYSSKFSTFLKKLDGELYLEYKKEFLKETKQESVVSFFDAETKDDDSEKLLKELRLKTDNYNIKKLKKISSLSANDSLKIYVSSRKIPNTEHFKMFSCPNFMSFTNKLVHNKFSEESLLYDEKRLLIPFYDSNNNIHAYQGRSLDPNSKSKYITIVLNEDVPKIFGLDRVDFNKRTYVFEGPIDAMFIPNSIATAGGDLVSSLKGIDNKKNLVIVYDNEKRSKETIKKMEKAIDFGYDVVIWPESIDKKDINDMILSGYTVDQILYIMDTNVYNGMQAKLRLLEWKKI
jgi:transcription elongation factor Elf1